MAITNINTILNSLESKLSAYSIENFENFELSKWQDKYIDVQNKVGLLYGMMFSWRKDDNSLHSTTEKHRITNLIMLLQLTMNAIEKEDYLNSKALSSLYTSIQDTLHETRNLQAYLSCQGVLHEEILEYATSIKFTQDQYKTVLKQMESFTDNRISQHDQHAGYLMEVVNFLNEVDQYLEQKYKNYYKDLARGLFLIDQKLKITTCQEALRKMGENFSDYITYKNGKFMLNDRTFYAHLDLEKLRVAASNVITMMKEHNLAAYRFVGYDAIFSLGRLDKLSSDYRQRIA